ncbi:MAG: lamin tail domain-containing protein [Phycisphaerales bacterium]|nr:lamin tail domain-containing protein [Phycisphaerales bacterium]
MSNRAIVVSLSLLGGGVLALPLSEASAQVRITEFMSEGQGDIGSGNGGRRQREFFELTNLGPTAVDTSAWSFNDNNINDPHFFGTVIQSIAPGESVILTQMTAADFRAWWNLPSSVQVYSIGQTSNLGNADMINIYNSNTQDNTTLVDTLAYLADARGSGISRNRPFGGTGQALNVDWVASILGDSYGSVLSGAPGVFAPNFPTPDPMLWDPALFRDLANPGQYIPAPTVAASLALAALPLTRRRR